jgi:hypothetical protein
MKILLTDHDYADLNLERATLEAAGSSSSTASARSPRTR